MKKRILIISICTVTVIILAGISQFVLPILSYFMGSYTEVSLPVRSQTAPENVDITNDIQIARLRANYGYIPEGYCEPQADTLRKKILNTENTEKLYKISGTKYYISSSEGDDNNDGLTPETALKSINGMDKILPKEGDAILFKRGDVFRFGKEIVTYNNIIYGAYGDGVKPKIYGSPENYAQNNNWKKHNETVWKISFNYPEACGLVLNHSELIGIKKENVEDLHKNGDYYHDIKGETFYLYCDKGIPSSVYFDIEIMPTITLFDAIHDSENIVIDNLCLKYTSSFAVHVVDAQNFTVTNCEIGFTGGKWTNSHERKLRYGNAIEFWEGAVDVKVENNWIYQTFDSALTWQGKIGCEYKNISFSGNLFEYNNCDIEFFENDATLENFRIENNIMRFTSLGWGTKREDGGIRGIEGVVRGVTGSHPQNKPTNVISAYFTNNIIDCPSRQIINWSWEPEHSKTIHTSGTKLYVKESYRSMKNCLQGLQTQKGQSYYKSSATDFEELKNDFKIFEKNAKIYWHE